MSHPYKSSSGANAKRRPAITNRPPLRQVSSGFFDKVQDRSPLPSLGSRPRAPLVHFPSLLRRLLPNIDEPKEPQQCPRPGISSRRSPPVVDVPALDDKKAVYVALRPARASGKGTLTKNPTCDFSHPKLPVKFTQRVLVGDHLLLGWSNLRATIDYLEHCLLIPQFKTVITLRIHSYEFKLHMAGHRRTLTHHLFSDIQLSPFIPAKRLLIV
ncbi:hypothetical protein C8R48DRAFT_677349 [Suillus tomentosus]|nr:hypothetical protein C8R48DRAFT_677349 [Suillus tomentosus]